MTGIVRNVLITGGNRGIGLQLVKDISTKLQPQILLATYRNVALAKELYDLAKANPSIHPIQFDLKDDTKFDEFAVEVSNLTKGHGLNLLINNAGISSKYAKLNAVRKEHLVENFEVNLLGPILLTKNLLPLLETGAKESNVPDYGISRAAVINISSILGSISANDNGGMYPYRCSKAALNAATKSMSIDFRRQKILAVAVHPGWAQTDMGGPKAPLTPQQSSEGIVNLLGSMNESHNGGFFQYDGKKLDW